VIRITFVSLALAAALAAGSAMAAPRDHILAFEHTRAGIFLERLDARTLRPLADKPRFVFVARRFPIDWDLSPDRRQLIVASNKARIVDLATFRVRTRCCLPFPVSSPDYVALLWTREGVEVIDQGGDTWNLGGSGNTLNAPYGLADFAKGPTGLVELYAYQFPGGSLSWALTENTHASAPFDVPELNGESSVAMAVDGSSIDLLTPGGALVTATNAGDSTRTIALPPAIPASGFHISAWSPGRLVVPTANELVLVQVETGTTMPLQLGATKFVTGTQDLVAWSSNSPRDGLFVYNRAGRRRLHLLVGMPIGCVTLHDRLAYVSHEHGKGCSALRTIVDLRTGRVIDHMSAPADLIG